MVVKQGDEAFSVIPPTTPGGGPRGGMTPQSKRPKKFGGSGGRYFFDAVHGPESTQSDLFEHVQELVAAAKGGMNACILAYGATGSGKTYTMQGTSGAPGLVPLAVDALFAMDGGVASSAPTSYKVTAVELYNDKISDLLALQKKNPLPCDLDAARKAAAEIRILGGGALHGSETFRQEVSTREEMHALLRRAQSARSVAATAGNERSSRSHQLIRIEIAASAGADGADGSDCRTIGRLEFVDLAGAEPLLGSNNSAETVRARDAIQVLLLPKSSPSLLLLTVLHFDRAAPDRVPLPYFPVRSPSTNRSRRCAIASMRSRHESRAPLTATTSSPSCSLARSGATHARCSSPPCIRRERSSESRRRRLSSRRACQTSVPSPSST